ncbi:MAG: DUF1540 domain-containing protein [Spirochaetes bacterium]|nr:DUF1540 domain-containing protein [Spirochaetota bacterium]
MHIPMTLIKSCDFEVCAFNWGSTCHALAITVGDGICPMCDTTLKSFGKGGILEKHGGVGACKVTHCRYNRSLECSADSIHVKIQSGHAECDTFAAW